jgi:hypothetical protein
MLENLKTDRLQLSDNLFEVLFFGLAVAESHKMGAQLGLVRECHTLMSRLLVLLPDYPSFITIGLQAQLHVVLISFGLPDYASCLHRSPGSADGRAEAGPAEADGAPTATPGRAPPRVFHPSDYVS